MNNKSGEQVIDAFTECDRLLLLMPTKHLGNLLISLLPIQLLLKQSLATHKLLVVDSRYRDIVDNVELRADILYFDRHQFDAGYAWDKTRIGLATIGKLRRFRPELAIDIEGEITSGMLTWASGAPVRVSPMPTRREGCYNAFIPIDHTDPHKYYHYAAISDFFGGLCPPADYPDLLHNSRLDDAVKNVLQQNGIDAGKPLVTIQSGATKLYKLWSSDYFAELTDWLSARGCQVIFTGAGKIDQQKVGEILGKTRLPCWNLVGKLSLGELLALQQMSSLFIGNDSGPTHLASAAKIPAVCFFGPTNDKIWGPLGATTQVLRGRIPCEEGCSTKHCYGHYRCMSSLDVDLVRDAITARIGDKLTLLQPAGA